MTRPLAVLVVLALAVMLSAQEKKKAPTGYTDTPYIPGSKWRVHDDTRPRPAVVTPAPEDAPAKPPADAVVLFDGSNLSKWRTAKGEAPPWKVENGYVEVTPKGGDIFTRDEFGDIQLHVEFRAPTPPQGDSQGRGNGGVFLMNQFEVQVLDSYDNVTYADGQAGAIYGQTPPLANASRKPGEWQSFDIFFTAPRFKDGKVERPPYVTVIHNGVLVQNHTEILGGTRNRNLPGAILPNAKGPIRLQDHNNPTRFRNIWLRPLDEPRP